MLVGSLRLLRCLCRGFSTTTPKNFKVCIVGAAGGIGQSLSLLMKRNKLVKTLSIYDVKNLPGVCADLAHIDTKCEVHGFQGNSGLNKALDKSHLVLITGGFPRKPGMERDDLFKKNADVVAYATHGIAKACPCALIAIITNPINTCVPLAAEILKQHKEYDPNRLFGVTTLDLVRTRTFLAEILNVDPKKVKVPVIGGHSGNTILPILSQAKPAYKPKDKKDAEKLIKRIQNAGTEVVKAKAGKGSATLSMAHAAAEFATSLLKGLQEDGAATECAYVASKVTKAAFFSTPLVLGKSGICKNLGLPKMNEMEKAALDKMLPELQKSIKQGIEYGKKSKGKDKDKSKDKCKGKDKDKK